MTDNKPLWALRSDMEGYAPLWWTGVTWSQDKSMRAVWAWPLEPYISAGPSLKSAIVIGAKLRLVKVTKKPKPKVVSMSVWEGKLEHGVGCNDGHAFVQGKGPAVHVNGRLLLLNNGTPVRVTLEVLEP